MAFIDEHRGQYGVEPIFEALPIAPSAYYTQVARRADPELRPARAKRDETLRPEIQRVWDENLAVYGADKVWRQLRREGFEVARSRARPGVHHDDGCRRRLRSSPGSRPARVSRNPAEPALGRGHHVRRHLGRVRLRRVRHRRLLAVHRRLACLRLAAERPGPRRPGAGSSHAPAPPAFALLPAAAPGPRVPTRPPARTSGLFFLGPRMIYANGNWTAARGRFWAARF